MGRVIRLARFRKELLSAGLGAGMDHWEHVTPDQPPPSGRWQIDSYSWYGLPSIDGDNFPSPFGKL